MARPSPPDDVEALLAEQIAYYRARAPEYTETAKNELGRVRDAALARLDAFAPGGDVLELACGPGTWTAQLLRHAGSVTAVDASPEMLALAADRVGDEQVAFVQADLFAWEPDRRYDAVFFGFWLSHVPLERFDAFWSLVRRALKPAGRVAFVDDQRATEELVESPSTVRRRLTDGTAFRAVKVPHTREDLEHRIAALGWRIEISQLAGPFFWGEGGVGR